MHRVPSSGTVDRILAIHNAVLIIPQLRHVRIVIDVLFKVLVVYFNISTVVLSLAVVGCCVGTRFPRLSVLPLLVLKFRKRRE